MAMYKKKSWELFNGNYFLKDCPDGLVFKKFTHMPIKIVHDAENEKIYVFNEEGKNLIPRHKNGSINLNSIAMTAASSRICVEDKLGRFCCLKSRHTIPQIESAKAILNINKSILEFAIETGNAPAVIHNVRVV